MSVMIVSEVEGQPVLDTATPAEALQVVQFWRDAGISKWFTKDPAFDRTFRVTFLGFYEEAARGELDGWADTPLGALALLILLDQFPRNCFRGTPRMYATDAQALRIAKAAVKVGHDALVEYGLRLFMYIPYGHSEDIADHEAGAQLVKQLGGDFPQRAERYSSVIRRFGRFPHRNSILGRASTSDEELFLQQGGFSG